MKLGLGILGLRQARVRARARLRVLTRKKQEYEKWHFHDRTLLRLAVFRVAFGHLYELW